MTGFPRSDDPTAAGRSRSAVSIFWTLTSCTSIAPRRWSSSISFTERLSAKERGALAMRNSRCCCQSGRSAPLGSASSPVRARSLKVGHLVLFGQASGLIGSADHCSPVRADAAGTVDPVSAVHHRRRVVHRRWAIRRLSDGDSPVGPGAARAIDPADARGGVGLGVNEDERPNGHHGGECCAFHFHFSPSRRCIPIDRQAQSAADHYARAAAAPLRQSWIITPAAPRTLLGWSLPRSWRGAHRS